jgi:drug/metabolite transporter (DMT)-like permease
MRICAPVFGPLNLAEYRVGLAAVFLLIVAIYIRKPLNLKQHWQHYFVLGIFNAALPFMLYGFAALVLTASVMSILNATAPIWGAIIGAVWLRQPMSARTVLGLGLGVIGVGLIVGLDHLSAQPGAGLAITAVLLATFCYGIATNYAKQLTSLDSFSTAHGSMWAASLFIVPLLPFTSAASDTTNTGAILAVIILGVVCTGIAFLLYFRLVKEIGGTSTLTVTFLIPAFGILWGHIFLGEVVSVTMIVGSLIVITGTALTTGFNPAKLFRQPRNN